MLINNRELDDRKILLLVKDIKRKKELNTLSDNFIRNHLFIYLKKNDKSLDFLIKRFNIKSSDYKKIIKEIRAELRRVYGLFRSESSRDRENLVNELLNAAKNKRKEIVTNILKTHSSTNERLPFYEELYKKIFKVTEKPENVIDLGSGINPFSYPFMKLKKLDYYAYDLSEEEMASLNKYFKLINKDNYLFKGKAEVADITKLKKLKKADLAFLFKMTDVLDKGKGHKMTEKVVVNVPARFVVVSFPTFTMSGKKMNFPRRKWIELMCKRLGYNYDVLEFSNELFYVIEKKLKK